MADTEYVVLMDRAGTGGFEFMFDGLPRVFAKRNKDGQYTLTVSTACAEHVFRNQKCHVHTRDGIFVSRLGVLEAPDAWIEHVGMDVLDTSPIEIDEARTRLEGWDAAGAGYWTPTIVRTSRLAREDYGSQAAATVVTGSKER